jgi:hypothetical protein
MNKKIIAALGIMILLVMSICASALELPSWMGGGSKKKTSSNVAKKLFESMTNADAIAYQKEREQYWLSQGERPDIAKKRALEDLTKFKAEKLAKDIEAKIGGYIGGALTGVFAIVGATFEGVIRSSPAKGVYTDLMDKIKYNTDLEYKVASVRAKNEIYWNRACDELEKLGQTCERPKAAPPVVIAKTGVVTGPGKKSTSKAMNLFKKYGSKK